MTFVEAVAVVREHARSLREPSTGELTAGELVDRERRYLEARAVLRSWGLLMCARLQALSTSAQSPSENCPEV